MRGLPPVVSLFTLLFFIFSLTGNVLIVDPTFSSSAFAQRGKEKKKEENDDKNKLKGNKRLREAVRALQEQVDTIELTPGPQGNTGPQQP